MLYHSSFLELNLFLFVYRRSPNVFDYIKLTFGSGCNSTIIISFRYRCNYRKSNMYFTIYTSFKVCERYKSIVFVINFYVYHNFYHILLLLLVFRSLCGQIPSLSLLLLVLLLLWYYYEHHYYYHC